MSRNANVFSDSKIFIDGISPVACLASFEQVVWRMDECVPRMILQKIQAAAIVVLSVGRVWLAR